MGIQEPIECRANINMQHLPSTMFITTPKCMKPYEERTKGNSRFTTCPSTLGAVLLEKPVAHFRRTAWSNRDSRSSSKFTGSSASCRSTPSSSSSKPVTFPAASRTSLPKPFGTFEDAFENAESDDCSRGGSKEVPAPSGLSTPPWAEGSRVTTSPSCA